MLSFLSWIPLLGPVLQGIGGIVSSFTSLDTVKMQTNAQVAIAETNASVQIIQATNDDICLRILRDALCLPVVAWCCIGGWDTIVAHHWPQLRFVVAAFPPSMSFMPYAVVAFLLGNIGLNMWNKK